MEDGHPKQGGKIHAGKDGDGVMPNATQQPENTFRNEFGIHSAPCPCHPGHRPAFPLNSAIPFRSPIPSPSITKVPEQMRQPPRTSVTPSSPALGPPLPPHGTSSPPSALLPGDRCPRRTRQNHHRPLLRSRKTRGSFIIPACIKADRCKPPREMHLPSTAITNSFALQLPAPPRFSVPCVHKDQIRQRQWRRKRNRDGLSFLPRPPLPARYVRQGQV